MSEFGVSASQIASVPGMIERTVPYSANPVLVKTHQDGQDISHFHIPGDSDYESILATVREIAERMRISFEDAADYLGYEVGFAIEHFSL